ncbi:MAG: hypothetical protein ACE14V_16225 [bacterium]
MWTYYQKAIRFSLLGLILILIGLLYPHTVYFDRVADGKVVETLRGETSESDLMPVIRDGEVVIDDQGRLVTFKPDLCKNSIAVEPGGSTPLYVPGAR